MLRTAVILLAAATAAATPLIWSKKTRTSELSLKLPAAVSHVPVLADRLYRGEIKQLEGFAKGAADPKDGQPSEPKQYRRGAWEMQVAYTLAVETGRLISLYREAYMDSHGAHPMTLEGGIVFDKPTNTNLHPLDLLRPGTDLAPLNRALCEAARAAKRARDKDWKEKEDFNFHCPTWKGLTDDKGKLIAGDPPPIALAAGDVPGKAGGLVFVYSPYDIGSYAEGPYDVVVPFSTFQNAVKPDYAGEFAGRPKPSTRFDG